MDFDQTYTYISLGDLKKNCLDFGDLDSIFKVTGGQRLFNNVLSALYLLKWWMNCNQT